MTEIDRGLDLLGYDELGHYRPERDTSTAGAKRHGKPVVRTLTLTAASDIKSRRVRWLWRDWIALRSLAVVAGEAGLGKSTLTNAWLVARITRGDLDGELEGHPADALVVSAEDDWETVIKPRLAAHGADLERVHRIGVEDENGECTLTLPDDVARLDAAIERLRQASRQVALVVLDPIGSFLSGSTDTHKESPVRRALAPLAALAMRRELVVLAVAHLNKDGSQRLLSRVSGAGAFGNAPRSVLGFARDPDDPEGEKGCERVIVHAKSNWGRYATSLAARIESKVVDTDDGWRTDVAHLVITGESSVGVDDLARGRDDDHESVEAAIISELDGGERPSLEVKEAVAKRLGCSMKTVERHAVKMRGRDELGIEKSGWPPTSTWALTLGTAPTTRSVPNVEPPINTGDSLPVGDVGDTQGTDVPNSNGYKPMCSCGAPADLTDDGRCGRCYGRVIA